MPSSYGAPRKLISCSGPSCVQEKSTRIEVPFVSHAAWTYCRTGKSFKMLKRERRVGGVSRMRITHF